MGLSPQDERLLKYRDIALRNSLSYAVVVRLSSQVSAIRSFPKL